MGRVYDVFDKFSIIDIIIGLILGFILAIHHDNSNLWLTAIQLVIIFAIIMTIFPVVASVHAKYNHGEKIAIRPLIEAFILNVAMIAVCVVFGMVIGSFLIGNFIID